MESVESVFQIKSELDVSELKSNPIYVWILVDWESHINLTDKL